MDHPVLFVDMAEDETALKLGPKQQGQCDLCGSWDGESQTAPKRNADGKVIKETVLRTEVQLRRRRGKIIRVPVPQQPKEVTVRIRLCQKCLETKGYKKRPRLPTFGITRFETYRLCPERFWKEPFLPTSDAMEQGSADHAVFNWFNAKGTPGLEKAVLAYKPGVNKSPVFHEQGPAGKVFAIRMDHRFTKIRETNPENDRTEALLDHALLSLKRAIKFGLIRTRGDWAKTRYRGRKLDNSMSEFGVEATLSEVESYYGYQPKKPRPVDARFRGLSDFKLHYAGNFWQFLFYVDYKGYHPTEEELTLLANSPQLRWYAPVDAMRHGVAPERLKQSARMRLVFITPEWHQVVPVKWKRGDPGDLLDELNDFVIEQAQAQKAKMAGLAETERVTQFFKPKQGPWCEKCPVLKHHLCSYWDPSAAKIQMEDQRHNYPEVVSEEEIKIKF